MQLVGRFARRDGKRPITSVASPISQKSKPGVSSRPACRLLSMLANLNGVRIAGIAPETLVSIGSAGASAEAERRQRGRALSKSYLISPGLVSTSCHWPMRAIFSSILKATRCTRAAWNICAEYFGKRTTDDEEGEPVPGHPKLRFRAFWAHDRVQEKHAFAELMAFLMARLSAFARRTSLSLRTLRKDGAPPLGFHARDCGDGSG